MNIFMTGATGFIGGATARHLTEQGHQLTCLVRDRSKAGHLADLGCDLVDGDLSDRARLAEEMKGADAVVHGAALYEVGIPASQRPVMVEANVTGTANVLNACLDAGIPRVLYVSTVAVFGNTNGVVVDEDYKRSTLDFDSVYEETKYEAHLIAHELIEERGLPCVIVQPGGVYGPEDHSAMGQTISNFLDGRLPMIPFGELGMGATHVEDVAAGIALALDKGEAGESYILNAENTTMRGLIEVAAATSGKKAPKRDMPTGLLKLLRPIGPLVGKIMGQPPNLSELIRSADGVTFWVDGDKARKDLGFRPRDVATGMHDTLAAEGRLDAPA